MKITQNGIEIFTDDETSIKMIYNNLIGANFDNHNAWLIYLKAMSKEVNLEIDPNQLKLES